MFGGDAFGDRSAINKAGTLHNKREPSEEEGKKNVEIGKAEEF